VDQGARYAISYVPAADSAFYRFGSSILGYDCYTGQELPPAADLKAAAVDWARVTAEPRRYGFHATLKAPFHLSSACTETQLVSAFDNFANIGHAVPMITPAIEMLSGFAAIVPLEREPPVDALAVACTTLFDAFRAPMTAQERARRVASGLSPSQMQNLDRWGYPFLFSDYRFHMTLTSTIQTRQRGAVLAALRERFQSMCGDQPILIDRLALLKQEASHAGFRVVSHVELRAAR
jgi:hypothetical protein